MKQGIFTISLVFACLLVGCGDSPPIEESSNPDQEKVEWFDGSVEEAFATAKATGRPLFLYWGAVWCPPCHNLKVNTFTKPDFLEAIQGFVPVYLDGDTERAQLWAEKYQISGYPTVILFSPTGIELFRMPSDVTPEQYGSLLRSVINDFRPVHQILDEILSSGPVAASTLDLEIVAYHSWGQDPHNELEATEALDAFWSIYHSLPQENERLRARYATLTLDHAMAPVWWAVPAQPGATYPELNSDQSAALRQGVAELLDDADLWADNKIFLTLQSRRTVQCLEPDSSPGRDELIEMWLGAAQQMQVDPGFSATEQLMAFVPEFELGSLREGEVSGIVEPELRERVRARAVAVTSAATDPEEFQSTLNMVVWLLTMAELPEEAAALLDEHMDQTVAPHYFLSILGNLATDNPETALKWHRMAFERSGTGSARIKWGAEYIQNLIRLSPQDAESIEMATGAFIGEFATFPDAFAGRNDAYLQAVNRSLQSWADANEGHSVIERLRAQVLEQCDRFGATDDEVQRERCASFLAPGATEVVAEIP